MPFIERHHNTKNSDTWHKFVVVLFWSKLINLEKFQKTFWNFSTTRDRTELNSGKKFHNVLILNIRYITNAMACFMLINLFIGGRHGGSISCIKQLFIRRVFHVQRYFDGARNFSLQ